MGDGAVATGFGNGGCRRLGGISPNILPNLIPKVETLLLGKERFGFHKL